MSDKDTIAALQRHLAAAEVERLRLVAEVERLREALEQVLVDINDPHPRTSTLEGFRGAIKSTEAMALRALARNNAPLVTQETP